MTEKFKICMVGGTGVGKTSLVRRFVSSVFDPNYATTIGVEVSSRRTQCQGRPVNLVLWDLSGEDEFQSVQPAYLRGASSYLLVMDVTRRETADVAISLRNKTLAAIGIVPFAVVFNKCDLVGRAEVDERVLDGIDGRNMIVAHTSAKTGVGVTRVFDDLVDRMMSG